MSSHAAADEHLPLLSNRTIVKLAALVVLFALLTASISVLGKLYGHKLSLSGHTEDTNPVTLLIGDDVIDLPANAIRFADQRRSGRIERADVYLAWPEMTGYSAALADRFNNAGQDGNLIFLQLSQSVMTRDMSGRLEPIYARLFSGATDDGPAGLTIHMLKPEAGFGDDVILTGASAVGAPFVVRCQLPVSPATPSDADCQRDIHIGKDLSLIYRFSSRLLPQWRDLDSAVTAFAARHVRR